MTRKTITATLVIAGAVLLFSVMAAPASAQDISVVAPTAESGLSMRVVQLFVLVTVLSMAPGIAMMVTCLPFMLIVFSILRQAIGLQQSPPNMLIVSLALFLTYFV
ncbi:MAG: flagellar biosynthetic protein FliP, partial [Amphiplicatus sp.]|nr:flagellar biosynthetic protein FliP [Amphiplicatus sp.]